MSSTKTTTYRCPHCGWDADFPVDDDMPVCNRTDRCGLLFDDDRVVQRGPLPAWLAALTGSRLTFRPCDTGYVRGDDRAYYVLRDGTEIGVVEREWGIEGGRIWGYGSHRGNVRGSGRTRVAAVTNAYKQSV